MDGWAIWPEQKGIEGSATQRGEKFRQDSRHCRTRTAMGQRHTVAAGSNGGQQWQAATAGSNGRRHSRRHSMRHSMRQWQAVMAYHNGPCRQSSPARKYAFQRPHHAVCGGAHNYFALALALRAPLSRPPEHSNMNMFYGAAKPQEENPSGWVLCQSQAEAMIWSMPALACQPRISLARSAEATSRAGSP